MSKSFTASAVLLLRDAGSLALDDPAASYVPELAGWRYGAADAAPVTIRQLLTMTAGFPTDDPWGDRQQGLPIQAFDELLARGVSFNWAPGTRFEYSNLGYAILGRVVTAASGVPYDEFIRTRLLAPLRLDRTGFEAGRVPGRRPGPGLPARPARLGRGPVRPLRRVRPDGRRAVVRLRPRALGGGVRGRVPAGRRPGRKPGRRRGRAAPAPPRLAPGDAAPAGGDRLARGRPAARRPARVPGVLRVRPVRGRGPGPRPDRVAQRRLPRVRDQHAVAPGDRRRRDRPRERDLRPHDRPDRPRPGRAAAELADVPRRARASGDFGAVGASATDAAAPWPETLAAAEAVNRLLLAWDDGIADALFSENVALDSPYGERRHAIDRIRARIGDFTPTGRPGRRVRRDRARPSPTPRPTAAGG